MARMLIAGVAAVAIIALVLLLNSAFPNVLADDRSRLQVFATLGWLVLLIGGVTECNFEDLELTHQYILFTVLAEYLKNNFGEKKLI